MNISQWDQGLRERLKAVVHRFVGCRAAVDISDLVSSAIVAAYRKREQFQGTTPAELHAWLRTIVEHKCISRFRAARALRREAGRTVPLEEKHGIGLLSREVASEREISHLLVKIFEQLDEQHAELLYLKNHCGLSHTELAAKSGLTKNQVSCRLRTAHKRLYQALTKLGMNE